MNAIRRNHVFDALHERGGHQLGCWAACSGGHLCVGESCSNRIRGRKENAVYLAVPVERRD
jgi:hypothetical protein